jgi:hypothetical protein
MKFSSWRPSVVIATLMVALTPVTAGAMPPADNRSGSGWVEPQAASWRTWVLTSGNQFRPGPPPDEATTGAELTQLQALADQGDTATLDQIAFWDTGAPSYRWNELTVSEALKHNLNSNYGTRPLALVHVGLSDAMVATWDAKYAYQRVERRLKLPGELPHQRMAPGSRVLPHGRLHSGPSRSEDPEDH